MATSQTTQGEVIYGKYEPWLEYQILPGCPECHAMHPLARKPVPQDTEHCPDCGALAAAPGPVLKEEAGWTFNPVVLYARACLWAGRKLGSIYERL
jgi:hypothetical protein